MTRWRSGAHEIIVEGRPHVKTFATFDAGELFRVVEMYTERILDLKKDKRFKYVHVYKNHGEITGSYIVHPHSHVLATPIVPHQLFMEWENSRNHYLQKGKVPPVRRGQSGGETGQARGGSEQPFFSPALSLRAWPSKCGSSPDSTAPPSNRGKGKT